MSRNGIHGSWEDVWTSTLDRPRWILLQNTCAAVCTAMLYGSCGLETWPFPKVYCFILWRHFALWLRAWRLVMAHGWDLQWLRAFWDLLWTVILVQPVSPGFAGGSDGKESACNTGDPGSIPGPGTSPWEGNGNPLQYSRLENSMDRGAWQATVYGVAKSWTWLSDYTSDL